MKFSFLRSLERIRTGLEDLLQTVDVVGQIKLLDICVKLLDIRLSFLEVE